MSKTTAPEITKLAKEAQQRPQQVGKDTDDDGDIMMS